MKKRILSILVAAILLVGLLPMGTMPVFAIDIWFTDLYVAGNGYGNWLYGSNWDVYEERNKMTQISDGIYEITYHGIARADDYAFKIAADRSWADNWGAASDGSAAQSGVEFEGLANYKDICFSVPEDNSTVTIRADVTNLEDYSDPIKITVTITAPAEVTLATADGAQMRLTGKQGLRFSSEIAKNGAHETVKEYGTVLIPTEDVENIEDLVIGATLNGHEVCKVPAVYKYAEDDDKITFTAVITDIAEQNYARSYTARAYAIMDDDTVVYSDTYTSRSIYQIAKLILEDTSASDAEVDAAQAIVDAVEQYGDNDASWPWN